MSAEELPVTQAPQTTAHEGPTAAPHGLTLVSVSRDGTRMLFVDETGQEFTAQVDDRLRAAFPTATTRRSEPRVTENNTATLRPRDIQNRIRGGESAEEVAEAAGTTVEKIMAFAGPVLAEREHMAERAQKASVRRRPGDSASSARRLGEAVDVHLGNAHATGDDVVWDAYRRPDGKWTLTATFDTSSRSGIAELTYDVPGNYVSLDNEDAHWLVGDVIATPPPATPAVDDLSAARQRRASGTDPIAEPDEAATQVSSTEDTIEQPLEPDSPVEAYLFDEPTAPTKRSEPKKAKVEKADESTPAAEEPAPAPAKPKRSPRRNKRASVPSWDEIMFGGPSGDKDA